MMKSYTVLAAIVMAGLMFGMAGCGKKETPSPENKPAESTPAEPEGDAKERSAAPAPIVEDARNALNKAAGQTAEGIRKDAVEPAQELLKKAGEDAIGTAREIAKTDVEAVARETVQTAADNLKKNVDELQANLQQKPGAGTQAEGATGFAGALKGAAEAIDDAALQKDMQRMCKVVGTSISVLPPVQTAEKLPVIAFVEITGAPAATSEVIRAMITKASGGAFVLLDRVKSEQAVKTAAGADYVLTAEAKPDDKGTATIYQFRLKSTKDSRSTWAYDARVSKPAETELLKKLPGADVFGK
ncbi:MAG TPA: hypothetical protein VM223_01350 [Planctomycetota bacterium]|nr:hypothetical protein [Planctomycetota bacterium]